MAKTNLLKNIPFSDPQELASMVEYAEGQVVSRTLCQNSAVNITVFAFDKGEGISAHTVSADALVHVLDGTAKVTIGDEQMRVSAGQVVAMPNGVPHALDAEERFKMFLVVVRPQTITGIG
jgi:quercetin dioxygenase-like cupin family protein